MTLAFPKPKRKKSEKQKRKREDGKWVSAVRKKVVERDIWCRSCPQIIETVGEKWGQLPVEMHEIKFRSQTRGLPIEERINTGNCILLCRTCHRAIHDSKLKLYLKSEDGADGPVAFEFVG
jgi:hypothetical protein